jgi:hypothetical protein
MAERYRALGKASPAQVRVAIQPILVNHAVRHFSLCINLLLRFVSRPKGERAVPMISVREMKSPIALAACGAFLVPEPLGICLVLAAAIWWLWRKIGLLQQQTRFIDKSRKAAIPTKVIGERTVSIIRADQWVFEHFVAGEPRDDAFGCTADTEGDGEDVRTC